MLVLCNPSAQSTLPMPFYNKLSKEITGADKPRTRASMSNAADFVTINDTRRPRTGGDYVYTVMKRELLRQGYRVSEVSVPALTNRMKAREPTNRRQHTYMLSAETMAHFLCYLSSLRRFMLGSRLLITSSCPTFPVFGHLTYHQPKAPFAQFSTKTDSTKRRIAYKVQENEKLSPSWFFVKKLLKLHLSNSKFTKEFVKKIYGVESKILYPPVPVRKYLHINIHEKRKPCILIARPEAATGISILPRIAEHLPKNAKIIVIGDIDRIGMRALRVLKRVGVEFKYLGYLTGEQKIEIFRRCPLYINLAVNETFGITIIEALAAGCVPIAHDSGGVPEYLPSNLRYSTPDEAAEKAAVYMDTNNRLREELRNIALKFDEPIFRERFMVFVRKLETLLGLDGAEGSRKMAPATTSEI